MTNNELRRIFHIFQAKVEKLYTPKLLKVFKKQAKDFVDYSSLYSFGEAVKNIHHIINASDYIPVINAIHKASAAYGFIIYKNFKDLKRIAFGPNETISKTVLSILRMSLMENVNGISDTLKKDIIKVIEEGNQNGWGYEKTARKIQDIVGSKVRALRIVRTESVKGANLAAVEGFKLTGLQADKVWVTAKDSRVRGNPAGKYPTSQFDHWDMDGQTIPFEKPFLLGSRTTGNASDNLQYPGDPNGAPGDIINCRCTLGFKVKRDAQGKPVRTSPIYINPSRGAAAPIPIPDQTGVRNI